VEGASILPFARADSCKRSARRRTARHRPVLVSCAMHRPTVGNGARRRIAAVAVRSIGSSCGRVHTLPRSDCHGPTFFSQPGPLRDRSFRQRWTRPLNLCI